MLVLADHDTATPERRRSRDLGLEVLTVLGLFVEVFVVYLIRAQPSAGPVIVADEYGYLATARWFASAGDPIDMSGTPFYSPAYSLLASIPAHLFEGQPLQVYRATVLLNVALTAVGLLLAAWLGAWLLRSSRSTAIVGAATAALLPSLIFNASVGIAEAYLVAMLPATVIAVVSVTTDLGSTRYRQIAIAAVTGGMIGWLPASHNRMIPVAAVLTMAGLGHLVARREWQRLIGAAGGLMVGGICWQVVAARSERSVWHGNAYAHEDGMVTALTTGRGIWQTAQVIGGHAWSFSVASGGMASLGIVVVVRFALQRSGPLAASPARWLTALVEDPRRLCAATLATILAVTLGVSATFMSAGFLYDMDTPDMFVYGRYLDNLLPLLIVIGVVAAANLVRRAAWQLDPRSTAATRVDIGVATAVVVLLGLAVAGTSGDEFQTGWFNPFSSLNVSPYGTDIFDGTRATLVAMLSATAIGLVVVAAARRWTRPRVAPWAIALLVALPAVRLFEERSQGSEWIIGKLRADGQPARDVARSLRDLEPSEVWLDGSLSHGERMSIEFWTPGLTTERTPVAGSCPADASGRAVLVRAIDQVVSGELFRFQDLAGVPCEQLPPTSVTG